MAVVQRYSSGRRVAENVELARRYTREAAGRGAEVVVFPEMWNIGYRLPAAGEAASPAFRDGAAAAQDRYLADTARTAAETGVAIVATYLEVTADGLRNAAALVGPSGDVVLRYAKVHLATFAGESVLSAGEGYPVADLALPGGRTVRIGLLLCYDRVFPEAAGSLAAAGAEVVLIPNAGPLCENRLWQVRTRAFENKLAVAVANYPGHGHSIVCDGIAFDESGAPRDHTVLLADGTPRTPVAEIPLAALRAYRAAQPWGAPSSPDVRVHLAGQGNPGVDLHLLHRQA
ncbi:MULTISPECIES: carbon-nitrogen hydrolase family protein [unclassified Amycolatopsis]|uniref:carbon-nitrogen hydrolase family protein n=1 Tax=unclassified Amycolatopsis TaxID=2618356 RepID=UPI002874970C|nr:MULTISPECIES: carbon-nitrogen hydrolase family protein [unclassified Amycolatopsis]MDS0139963.1 carbon-nitrogen hydrolase family protein [Amycolatopsis sp. 505]MDS0148125.1 carbon-nitrogen hydrolase family protein [Amycolatopsis sp. CM201R]